MLERSSHSVRHDAVPSDKVVAAARGWARDLKRSHPEVVRVGYFGSYARGDYVPGSDLDVLIELSSSEIPRWPDRRDKYQPAGIPVGVEVFAYLSTELDILRGAGDGFVQAIEAEIVWLV